jgi:hypothetical protein
LIYVLCHDTLLSLHTYMLFLCSSLMRLHFNVFIILLLLIIIIISFMQRTYNYIPETNHVSREYSVAAIL